MPPEYVKGVKPFLAEPTIHAVNRHSQSVGDWHRAVCGKRVQIVAMKPRFDASEVNTCTSCLAIVTGGPL